MVVALSRSRLALDRQVSEQDRSRFMPQMAVPQEAQVDGLMPVGFGSGGRIVSWHGGWNRFVLMSSGLCWLTLAQSGRRGSLHHLFRLSPSNRRAFAMSDKVKILFLAANPKDSTQLRLDQEIREIHARVQAAEFRDSFELVSRWAVRPLDLLQALNEVRPHVVHFSGHGSRHAELILEDDHGTAKPVMRTRFYEPSDRPGARFPHIWLDLSRKSSTLD